MYKDFMGEKVTVIVSSRGEHLLEYKGILKSENENEILLDEMTCSYLLNNFSKGLMFAGSDSNRFVSDTTMAIINKNYIISCNK